MASVGKLIKLGKYASKTIKFLNAPNRISELIEKGYSEEMAQKMAYAVRRLGLDPTYELISQGIRCKF